MGQGTGLQPVQWHFNYLYNTFVVNTTLIDQFDIQLMMRPCYSISIHITVFKVFILPVSFLLIEKYRNSLN